MATLEPLYSFLVSYNSSFCLKDTLFSFLKTAKQSNMLLIEIKKTLILSSLGLFMS